MVWLAGPKILGTHNQLLCGRFGIGVQRDRLNPAFGFAPPEANLISQEVNPP
jgi:hypothetical protein